MADTKISALPASTTPLAGTEVVPLVQSGTTKNVSVANLTAGRGVAMASGTTTGDFGVGTAPAYRLNVVTPAVAGRQNMSAINRTLQNFVTFTNPAYSTDASMGVLLRVFPQSDARQGAGMIASGGAGNSYTNLDLFISEDSGGASVSKSVLNMDGVSKDVKVTLGNLVIGTSGKGIDFSATASGSGTMTSELLADYEEGDWTPTGNNITFASATGKYTKVGNIVTVSYFVQFPSTADANNAQIQGLPYTCGLSTAAANGGYNSDISVTIGGGTTYIYFGNAAGTAYKSNANLSNQYLYGFATYRV